MIDRGGETEGKLTRFRIVSSKGGRAFEVIAEPPASLEPLGTPDRLSETIASPADRALPQIATALSFVFRSSTRIPRVYA